MSNRINIKDYYQPVVFVLASPSAAGKTTLCYQAVKRDKNIWYSVSATTRTKRPYEKNGREYYFMTRQEFDRKLKQGELLESTKIYDAYYGTPKTSIIKKLRVGKDVILDLDIAGVKSLKRFYPHTVGVYIIPPNMRELWARLKNRKQSSTDKIRERFQKAEKEMSNVFKSIKSNKSFIDYVIVNNDLPKAVDDLMAIIRAERLRVANK